MPMVGPSALDACCCNEQQLLPTDGDDCLIEFGLPDPRNLSVPELVTLLSSIVFEKLKDQREDLRRERNLIVLIVTKNYFPTR